MVTLVRFVKNVVNGRVVAVAETQLRVEELLKSIVPGMDGTARLYIYTDDGTLMYASDEGDGDSYFDNAGEGGSRRTELRIHKYPFPAEYFPQRLFHQPVSFQKNIPVICTHFLIIFPIA